MTDPSNTKERKSRRGSAADLLRPLRVLGWLAGGLSLLNMIEDLSPLKVFGQLKSWLDAYTSFVSDLGAFLFGWIEYEWIAIDDREMHILILAMLLVGAYARAVGRMPRTPFGGVGDQIGTAIAGVVFYFSCVLLPAILVPSWYGLAASAAVLTALGALFLTHDSETADFPQPHAIRVELVGVCGVFVLLVALNYTVFRA